MAVYRIRPLNCGSISSGMREYWGGRLTGGFIEVPSIIWLIEGGPYPILVDAAFHSTENGQKGGQWVCKRSPEEEPEYQLRKAGVDPKDVKMVLLTHMHWDHDGCVGMFPNATKYIWRRELQYWAAPCRTQMKPFEAPCLGSKHTAPWVQDRVTFQPVDEKSEILPGITYFPMPGHTIGECGIAVKADSGTYVLSGDLFSTYACPGRPEPWPELDSHCVIGQTYSLKDAANSVRSVIHIASSAKHILPSHDFKVFEKEVYK